MPISAPNPNIKPSVNLVDAFTYTQAESISFKKRCEFSYDSVIIASECPVLFSVQIFRRGAAPDPEDILLDLFGGEAASLRAVRRLLRGRLRLALALLTPTALRSIPPGLDWPKLGGSQGCRPECPAYSSPGSRSDSTGR